MKSNNIGNRMELVIGMEIQGIFIPDNRMDVQGGMVRGGVGVERGEAEEGWQASSL